MAFRLFCTAALRRAAVNAFLIFPFYCLIPKCTALTHYLLYVAALSLSHLRCFSLAPTVPKQTSNRRDVRIQKKKRKRNQLSCEKEGKSYSKINCFFFPQRCQLFFFIALFSVVCYVDGVLGKF